MVIVGTIALIMASGMRRTDEHSTGIPGDATVRCHHKIDIDAPLDKVWRLHTDVNARPAWRTDITAAPIDGPFQLGGSFEWTC